MSGLAVSTTEQESRAALLAWEAERRNAAEYARRAGLRTASVRGENPTPLPRTAQTAEESLAALEAWHAEWWIAHACGDEPDPDACELAARAAVAGLRDAARNAPEEIP